MGIFSKLFGTEKAVDNLLDKDTGLIAKAGASLDRLHFSDEEKADNNIVLKKLTLSQLATMEPFKVVQRILIFSICSMWVIVGLSVMVMIWMNHPQLNAMIDFGLSEYVWLPSLMAFGLYLGGGTIESYRKK